METAPLSPGSKFDDESYGLISPSVSTTSLRNEPRTPEALSLPTRILSFDEASTIQLLRDKEKRIQEEVELRTNAEKDLLKEMGLRTVAQAELIKEHELRTAVEAELNSSKEVNKEIRKAISDTKEIARQEKEFSQLRIREIDAEKAVLHDALKTSQEQKEAVQLRIQAAEEKNRELVLGKSAAEEKLNHEIQTLRDNMKEVATSHLKVTEEIEQLRAGRLGKDEELNAKNVELKELQIKQARTERQKGRLSKDLDMQQERMRTLEEILRGIHESSRILAPAGNPPNRSPHQDTTSPQSPPRKRRRRNNEESSSDSSNRDTSQRSPSLAGSRSGSGIHGSPERAGNSHRLEVRRERSQHLRNIFANC